MQFLVIQRILGLLLIFFSLSMLPPILVSVIYDDGELMPFISALVIMVGMGLLFWYPVRHAKKELHLHDGFLITAVFWSALSLFSALPFLFAPHLSLAQSVFEAISGFTTTGATVISGLDNLPKSVLYYRQQLHFFGGAGILVLAVAVLPMLGIGGSQLLKAETPGPMRDDKLTPRLENTTKAMVYIYLSLTIACAIAFWLAGMDWFDAIGHSYSTVATGGFSTHDASFAYFNSPTLEVIAMIFMVLGSFNFTIHFIAWHKMDIRHYWYDLQCRMFVVIILVLTAICVAVLMWKGVYTNFLEALRYASFQIISIISTTGFLTADFSQWPLFVPVIILGSSFIGGCVNSTAGGIRVIRVILLYKQAIREIMRLIHPNAVMAVKINNKKVPATVTEAVWGFVFLYMISYLVISILLMGTGMDLISAFSGAASCLNLTGPGLGQVTMSFSSVSEVGLWILSFAMLLGRLEVFTLLVLLSPSFWRR